MLSKLRQIVKYLRFYGGAYRCCICNRPLRKYLPFSEDLQLEAKQNGFVYDFKRMETLNWVQCNCPFCMSIDRERLYFIYLLDYFKQEVPAVRSILDFAPSYMFSNRMRRMPLVKYDSADLIRKDVDLQIDICDMKQIQTASYDVIICSHILEHVDKPENALFEIFRVMKDDAIAIIMVPLFWDVKQTVEDPTAVSEELRCKFYGQADHVRLFSKIDLLGRLKSTGFFVSQITPDKLDNTLVTENAISENSILYVCSKTASKYATS